MYAAHTFPSKAFTEPKHPQRMLDVFVLGTIHGNIMPGLKRSGLYQTFNYNTIYFCILCGQFKIVTSMQYDTCNFTIG